MTSINYDLEHRLGIINVGNNIIRDMIETAHRYKQYEICISEIKHELQFLLSETEEMERLIKDSYNKEKQ